MVSKHIIEIVIQAEDQASKVAKRVQKDMQQIGNAGTTGFSQLTKAQQKALMEMGSLDTKSRNVMQDMQRLGSIGRNTFQQLSTSSQKALTSWDSLSQSQKTIIKNFSQFNVNAKSASTALAQMELDPSINRNLQQAKVHVSSLGYSLDSTKGKILAFGYTIKSNMVDKWNMVKNKAKSTMSNVKSSINSAISSLKNFGNAAKTAGNGMGFLRSAASMTVGMVGYDLVNSMMQSARESINAAGKFEAFGKRLKMSEKELESFHKECDDMQSTFRKVDMNAVGASAMELGVKLKIPKNQMGELTKMTAVMSSAFVNEGRTQEDAILAVSDAMDGQFKRLQELGITQAQLIKNGWNGNLEDTKSLMNSINKTMDEMGFTETAQGIYTLDDAYKALTVSGGRLLSDIIVPLTPLITTAIDAITNGITLLKNAWNGLPDWAKDAIAIGVMAAAVLLLVGYINSLGGILAIVAPTLETIGAIIAGLSAPIVIAVAAIGALMFAVYELGKAFGWWTDVSSMIDAVKAGLQRLWSAFINNPDVQSLIRGISNAWKDVSNALTPVINSVLEFLGIGTGGEFDVVRAIIDNVGAAFHQVANAVRTAIGVFQTIYGVFQGIASFLAPYGQMIYDFLKPIVCILLGCSPGIVPALEKVQEVFQTVWNFIAGFIGSYVSTIVSVISTVVTTIQNIVNVFGLLLSGQISLGEAIPMIWNLISNAFITIGGTILNFITGWAGQLLTLAIRAATNFMNGIINKIKNLPGKVYNFITQTANRIRNGAVNWAKNARNAATNTVNSVVTNIQGLPGKVYTEFFNIGNRIGEAAAHVIKKAADFANGVKNKILDILGIHSPGILQEKIGVEFQDIADVSIGSRIKDAYYTAKNYASNIIGGFQSEDMSQLDVSPSVSTTANIPTADGMNDSVINAYSDMNNLVGADLATLESMNTTSFGNISNMEESTMDNIYKHITKSLLQILSTTKSSMTNNTKTTQTQLNKMQSSTKSVTKGMTKAWGTMKNSIVSAANNIKTQTTSHFNSLSTTIGNFYRKLQNPSQWGAGPGSGTVGTNRAAAHNANIGTGPMMRVMSSLAAGSAIRESNAPRTIRVDSARKSSILGGITDFISGNRNIDVRTLLETGVLSPNQLGLLTNGSFGDWDNIVNPNVQKIKSTANKWSMKGPRLANRVNSGLSFHVSDFISGTPKIGLSDFISMAYALVNSTSYGYYADSSRYGSWLNALRAGEMNCSDGSDMLIALARTCGLSAEKVHCYWGTSSSGIAGTSKGEGHFVARIGGQIMDSVSMRHGSLTSPKVHGYGTGPAPIPRSSGTSNNDEDPKLPDELKLDISDFTIHHDFTGLPEGVDEATVVRMIQESGNDETFIKNLVNSLRFQVLDQKAKLKLERKQNRSKGIGA